MVHKVTSLSNTMSRAIDFGVDSILQGYITEFAVEAIKSYSEDEIKIFQGPRRRYMLSISKWIKILVYEKGILHIE